MSNVLTNNTSGSIILTLNTNSPGVEVLSMSPGESLLYDSVVITDENNTNYNEPLIQEYIDNGILLKQNLIGITESELRLLSSANLTINMSTGIPQLLSNAKTANNIDNQKVLASNDMYGRLQYIYYKSIQGMSVSMDFGASQSLINNSNLLYPSEITSFAIQVYDNVGGILKQVNRLFIGTLREGIKTFTPGVDSTYVDYDPKPNSPYFSTTVVGSKTVPTDPLFRNTIIDHDGTISFSGFCASYVLAIINEPYTSGCPIFIATRPVKIDYTIDILNPVITTEPIICFKYLHSQIYVHNNLTKTIPDSNQPSYVSPVNMSDNFILLSSSLPDNPSDDAKIANIINQGTLFNTSASPIDVITEYIPTGAILIIKSYDGFTYTDKLYKITLSDNISSIPIVSSISLVAITTGGKIKNVSYLTELDGTNYNIFITTDTIIWRYSSRSETWERFLYPDNSSATYLSTSITDGILVPSGGATNLKELSNFIMLPKINTDSSYVGLLSSEIGLVLYKLKLVNNIFIADGKVAANQAINIARSSVITDMSFNIYGQSSYIFTCSYSSQIPKTWYSDVNCLQIINNNSALIKNVYYIKPDVEQDTDYMYYVSSSVLSTSSSPTSEQLSYNPVLLQSDYTYNLISPSYSFKMYALKNDENLFTALCSKLAHKYYTPYIIERIISSVSPAELDILELNDYKHAFQMNYLNSISVISELGIEYPVLNQQTVVITNPYYTSPPIGAVYLSFICIALDGSIVIPTILSMSPETPVLISDVNTILLFPQPFSGSIFVNPVSEGYRSPTISGFSAILNTTLTDRYPQVVLDSSVVDLLNDIKYIDATRLEISFKSSVNTTVNLV